MIKRNPRRHHFVIIDQDTIRDKRLSWKARGLLAYLLSLPDDWEISFRQLVHESPRDKATSLRAAFKELMAVGYASLEVVRNEANSRVKGKRYVVSETLAGTVSNTEVQVFSTSEILNVDATEPQKTCTIKKDLQGTKDLQETKDREPILPPLSPPGGTLRKVRKAAALSPDAQTVLTHLNTATGRTYHNAKHITARLQGDATVEHCMLVIDWWKANKIVLDPTQDRWFDNETPFRPLKFDKYRASAIAWDQAGRPLPLTRPGASMSGAIDVPPVLPNWFTLKETSHGQA